MTPPTSIPPASPKARSSVTQFLADYFWYVLKNIIGWVLILSAWPIGIAIPGPGGIPLFLIGFALITFPGKRKLAARVLRGRPLDLFTRPFFLMKTGISMILPVAGLWYAAHLERPEVAWLAQRPLLMGAAYLLSVALVWVLVHQLLRLGNLLVKGMPRARRVMRPWLRRHGVHLLPPRRLRRHLRGELLAAQQAADDDEIIQIHQRHYDRLRRGWNEVRRYIRFTVGAALTLIIVAVMLKPIFVDWDEMRTDLFDHAASSVVVPGIVFTVMFALFLLLRALMWRYVLAAFGHRPPLTTSLRIWSHSELARYIPGSIWQVLGRAFMLRPYGVSGSISSTTQILELALFLLANLVLAVACLLWYGTKQLDGQAELWLYVSMALVPAMCFLLHPKIFYGIANVALRRLGKPPIVQRLAGSQMVGLLLVTMLGLLWQAAGVYIVAAGVLDELQLSKWWVVAGAYSLAWCAGFLAFFSSAGLGVREIVFMGVMVLIAPAAVRADLSSTTLWATMGVIGFLLRIWTVAGELLLAVVATISDYRALISGPPARVPSAGGAAPTRAPSAPPTQAVQPAPRAGSSSPSRW